MRVQQVVGSQYLLLSGGFQRAFVYCCFPTQFPPLAHRHGVERDLVVVTQVAEEPRLVCIVWNVVFETVRPMVIMTFGEGLFIPPIASHSLIVSASNGIPYCFRR